MMNSTFPELFAIVRDSIRPPHLQVLTSYVVNRDWERRYNNDAPLYEVDHMPRADRIQGIVIQSSQSMRGTINVVRCRHPDTGEAIEVNWWFTSFCIRSEQDRIPILEFQTRSWIPAGYYPVPIQTNLNEMLSVMARIQEDRLAEIRAREDAASHHQINRYRNDYYESGYSNEYRPIRTPPSIPYRHRRRSISPAIQPPPPPARVIEVQVPVERVVIQNRALPLPKSVGDLLLKDARQGGDSCPIAATPYAQCEKLCVSSCFHIFDAASLAIWQADHTSCPVCRSKIENVVSE